MAKNNKHYNGAPHRDGRGNSSHGEHNKVRYGSFTQESQGRQSLSQMRRAGDAATLTYSQLKQVDLSAAMSGMVGKMLFRTLLGGTSSAQEDDNTKDIIPEYTPLKPKVYNPDAPLEDFENLRLFSCAIHVGDKCGVIAAKGVGKSALMMQIGNCIAAGKPTGLWPAFVEGFNTPQRVLYYDGELTDADMYNRYYKYGFSFHDNFERFDRTQFRSANDIIHDLDGKIEYEMETGEHVTVFFDNVTKILKTELVSEVNNFLEAIDDVYDKAQKKGIELTVVFIIHVLAKEYVPGSPINLKIAAGGSNLTNFLNSIIAVEKSRDDGGTIAVKILNTRGEPEPDSVCVLQKLGKDEGTHYHFKYVGDTQEKDYLKGESEDTKYDGPKSDGRGRLWTEEDTETLRELAATLDSPDAKTIADMMERDPVMIHRYANKYGIQLKQLPRGRKPKQQEQEPEQ